MPVFSGNASVSQPFLINLSAPKHDENFSIVLFLLFINCSTLDPKKLDKYISIFSRLETVPNIKIFDPNEGLNPVKKICFLIISKISSTLALTTSNNSDLLISNIGELITNKDNKTNYDFTQDIDFIKDSTTQKFL